MSRCHHDFQRTSQDPYLQIPHIKSKCKICGIEQIELNHLAGVKFKMHQEYWRGNPGDISLHRVAWKFYHPDQPIGEMEVHHVDHNQLNNSIENLALITRSEHRKSHTRTKMRIIHIPTGQIYDSMTKCHKEWLGKTYEGTFYNRFYIDCCLYPEKSPNRDKYKDFRRVEE